MRRDTHSFRELVVVVDKAETLYSTRSKKQRDQHDPEGEEIDYGRYNRDEGYFIEENTRGQRILVSTTRVSKGL